MRNFSIFFHFKALKLDQKKIDLFENYSIPKAIAQLAIPSVFGTLVMVLYNIADTYFVGMLNNSVETAAVSLAAPALLAFNAINNLFGVGASSMMSRSLGKKDYETVKRTASFSFYMAVFCALLISIFYSLYKNPVLKLLGADDITKDATARYLFWTVTLGAIPAILNVVLSNMVRSEGESLHASIGVMSGCFLNIILDPFFVLPQFLGMGAAGAGCATFIANCFSLLYLLAVVFKKRKTTCVCLNPVKFSFRKDSDKQIVFTVDNCALHGFKTNYDFAFYQELGERYREICNKFIPISTDYDSESYWSYWDPIMKEHQKKADAMR